MAGAITIGFSLGHALTMEVNRLSQIPLAILAKVFAVKGAITKTSAQSLKFI